MGKTFSKEKKSMHKVTILTLFPEMFPGPLGQSLLGKALDKKLWSLTVVDIRDFAEDKHQTVDEPCFGGGPGMVLRPDIIDKAIASVMEKGKARLIYLTPRGKVFGQTLAKDVVQSSLPLVFLCGRYEGIDQRVLDAWEVEEISLGDFVLTGGELAAMTILDATLRLIPGVIGDETSLEDESFSKGLLEYPHYTRPRIWKGREVPEVLLSGHHEKIATWRHEQAQRITKERRPDLWNQYTHYQHLN
ncbi:MAG: tRNA (guanosine(37)-N1)-methyltransferase TrmD [Alphaproteobacteria bacterium GWC2_42_16]|nr:MAG: tRNA (guanosine(37)-N1)-methyltransferase TrmD [Alphaproteobacteria bacterium GWC2_42_16]OFW73431.1 MAG: tRNA (guanosine(37)-N1)-methyltransferase TrmD [Alphaproteobacteria bacterium GWA2_41_27]OFW82279.1 MAG: tRNA (guanosine(37)-N1)-methyltransferase TrmD [Alphaproteobacteria bacterium RIFCSPHIGHO2_12_FULL_42_100]OFW86105.1 MAG: tRNA (guanosine(37)-N1)-methyltransferase TrmD [Alphaproteobacteria bacterium RBG_16_42_14]OFW91664.1 MAG: tRNA (guanosine(37)-N1)-methyltransferase TrmD [Alph